MPARPKAHPGRMKLPDHLRRETILLKPDGDMIGLRKIGEEVTGILDYVPGELYVKQYIRPKYAAPLDEVARRRLRQHCLADYWKNAWWVKGCWRR